MNKIALGKPAEYEDFIITRRINILKKFNGFLGKNLILADVGCGNGGSLIPLSKYFMYCHGVDIMESNLNQLKTEIKKWNIKNITCSLVDIDEVSIDKKFDRIISFEVLEHTKNDATALKNIYDSLKIDGLIAISVPNKWWIFETHGAYLPLLPWNRIPFFSWLPKCIHSKYAKARIYRKKEIKKLVENTGFKNVEIKYITAPMDVIKWKPLQEFLRKTIFKNNTTNIPFLATSIIVFARK